MNSNATHSGDEELTKAGPESNLAHELENVTSWSGLHTLLMDMSTSREPIGVRELSEEAVAAVNDVIEDLWDEAKPPHNIITWLAPFCGIRQTMPHKALQGMSTKLGDKGYAYTDSELKQRTRRGARNRGEPPENSNSAILGLLDARLASMSEVSKDHKKTTTEALISSVKRKPKSKSRVVTNPFSVSSERLSSKRTPVGKHEWSSNIDDDISFTTAEDWSFDTGEAEENEEALDILALMDDFKALLPEYYGLRELFPAFKGAPNLKVPELPSTVTNMELELKNLQSAISNMRDALFKQKQSQKARRTRMPRQRISWEETPPSRNLIATKESSRWMTSRVGRGPRLRQAVRNRSNLRPYEFLPASLQGFLVEEDLEDTFENHFLGNLGMHHQPKDPREFKIVPRHNERIGLSYKGGGEEDWIGLDGLETWTMQGKQSLKSWLVKQDYIKDPAVEATHRSSVGELRNLCHVIDMMLKTLTDKMSIGSEVLFELDVVCRRVCVLHLVLSKELTWSEGLVFLPLEVQKDAAWNPSSKEIVARRLKKTKKTDGVFKPVP